MVDTQTARELIELAIVAGASMFVCLTFVWWQRSLWIRAMDEQRARYERDKRDADEAHKVELRELDAFNAAERRRLETRISDLEAQLGIMVKVLNDRGIRMPGVVINAGGDATIGGDAVGGNKR